MLDPFTPPQLPPDESAAELFAQVGPWAGEKTEEILAILAEARRHGGQRQVGELCGPPA